MGLITFRGKKGYRVQSIRRRKRFWQGLVYPLAHFPEITEPYERRIQLVGRDQATKELLAESFASLLGVEKWEYTETALTLPNLGPTPSFLYVPGWRRVQDMDDSLFSGGRASKLWQVTEKLDGFTIIVYKLDKDSEWLRHLPALPAGCPATMEDSEGHRYGVCGRKEDYIDRDSNVFWEAAKTAGVLDKIHRFGVRNVAVHGELVGSSIEGNTMNYAEGRHEFVVFSVWDIDARHYLHPRRTVNLCKELGVRHVPVHGYVRMYNFAKNLSELLKKADGKSPLGGVREGFVFKSMDNGLESFKVISNDWLRLTGK